MPLFPPGRSLARPSAPASYLRRARASECSASAAGVARACSGRRRTAESRRPADPVRPAASSSPFRHSQRRRRSRPDPESRSKRTSRTKQGRRGSTLNRGTTPVFKRRSSRVAVQLRGLALVNLANTSEGQKPGTDRRRAEARHRSDPRRSRSLLWARGSASQVTSFVLTSELSTGPSGDPRHASISGGW